MGSNDALSDRQILEKIKDLLEHQGKTLRLRFYLGLAITFIVLSMSVLIASLSLGKTIDLNWFVLILLLVALYVIYWAWLELCQNYRKSFAVSGYILLVVGMLALDALLYLFPFYASLVCIVCYSLAGLIVLLGVILMSLAPMRIRKNRV
ncbi:MAG: hypothetical protein JXB43_09205 [Dehalococcoidia bacterium]|nr:hypothetical protein [Dehalococcoidia bacterium]